MVHINDLKRQAYLQVVGSSDDALMDLEHAWLVEELGLVDANYHIMDLWRMFLEAQPGVVNTTHVNDMMREWLTDAGYTGALPDQIYSYFSDKSTLQFSAIGPRAGGTIDVEPSHGSGSATFTRATVAHVRDHENVYRLIQANEARIQGARRVENHITDNDPANWSAISNVTIADGISDPDGGNTAYTITADAGGAFCADTLAIVAPGDSFRASLWIRRRTGSGAILLYNLGDTGDNDAIHSIITTEWQRVAGDVIAAITGSDNSIGVFITSSGDEVDVWHGQAENVSGASNQAPSEFVTAGESKYFTTTNGNSVASNVVTEVAGLSLHPTVIKKGQNVFARYATRADSTAYVVGERIITANGSGPAGGNGFAYECVVAGNSAASEGTFDETFPRAELADNASEAADFTAFGTNIVEDDAGAVKVTYIDNANGAFGYFSDAQLLNANLTIGASYILTGKAKINTGSVDVRCVAATNRSKSIASTEFVEFTIAFEADSAAFNYIDFTGMGAGEILWFKDLSLKQSTEDGTVGWENVGHYKLAGYLGEPAGTNSILQSRAFDTTWIGPTGGTGTETQDQVGFDGVANKAWELADTDNTAAVNWAQSASIPDDSNIHCESIFIAKDSNVTRFPEIRLRLTGGTEQRIYGHINTQTGAVVTRTSTGTVTIRSEDHGDRWRLILTVVNNSTGNTTATFYIYPAFAATLGGAIDVTLQDSIIIDQAQLELNTSVPSSPIITTTVAVTRNTENNYPNYPISGNFDETVGTMMFTWIPSAADTVDTGANRNLVDVDGSSLTPVYRNGDDVRSYDGTTTASYSPTSFPANVAQRVAVRWNAITLTMQVIVDGIAGIEVAFDGAYSIGSVIALFRNQTALGNIMSDLVIYDNDLGETVCEGLTDYD